MSGSSAQYSYDIRRIRLFFEKYMNRRARSMSEQGQTKQQTGFPESKLPRDPETGYFLDIPARIREIYKHNCFMSDFFHINIENSLI